MGKLFGTDGVRGHANTELTPEIAFNLGRAGTYVLTKENHHAPRILIGMDTRISCDMLESALAAGMCSLGATVYCAGIIPTPGIAYLVRKYNFDAGVVISASHNPFEDNGIKFFNSEGYKLPDQLENEIEDIIFNSLDKLPRPSGALVGAKILREEALDDYIDFLESTLKGEKLTGLTVVMDCANGATYEAAPVVFDRLGASISILHNEPDGVNINLNCGSTHMESLIEYVKENKVDLGMAFDGDGDRCLLCDAEGNFIDGDEVLSILGNYMKEEGTLSNDTIVGTVMSNLGLFIMGEKLGINIEKTAVGDRYVLEKMIEHGYSLGGEQSGHIVILEHNTTGDGIVTALQIAAIMKKTGKSLKELNTFMKKLPQITVNARVGNDKKSGYKDNLKINDAINGLSEKYKSNGRVLIRPSGTEPVIRVMIEGENIEELTKDAHHLAELIQSELN